MQFTAGSNTIDDIFIVKCEQNSFLYEHQNKHFKMFLRHSAS